MNGNTLKTHLLASSVFAGVLGGVVAMPAVAQETEEEARQATVQVTGTRILKQDFTANSPVSTVTAEQFDLTGTVNAESLLNTLPQTIPGLDRTSNNPGNGTATIDLRGLGSNRTLVLIDGRRVTPTSSGGTVDINNIPTALIERVEVVTGGASAVYGSDAVAGVVNFIMKDDFEGIEFSTGYEVTGEGDADIWSSSLTIGGNFANDRGNVVANIGFTDRAELFQGDRDFAFFAQFDDGAGNLFDGGSSGVPQGALFGANFNFPDGTSGAAIFDQNGDIRRYDGSVDAYNYAPVNYIQLPQERFQAYTKADYDITDKLTAFATASFAANSVPQQLAPTPIFEPRGRTETISLDGNPFISAAAQQIISDSIGTGVDTDGDGIDDTATIGGFGVRRRLEEVGPREALSEFTSWQIAGGLEFELSDTWRGDIAFSEGRVQSIENQNGNVNVDRFFQALNLADADGDGNVDLDANGNPSCSNPASNGATSACAPINIFGQGNISQEAADYITTRVVSDADYSQTMLSANLTGDTTGLFELPGGPVGVATGFEYREETFEFRPSQDLAASTIAGFNGSPPVAGSFDVYGFYGEAYLPFLTDHQYADVLAMELAYRYEDYNTVGGVSSYKVAGEWAPNEQIRFRASLNTAVRAPSIGELFSPQGEGFPGATDPCSSAFSGDATLRALCEATGVPAANVGSALIDPPSGQVRQVSGGNPNLTEETAETLTVGFVASPNFIEGLTFSVDYFDIEIEDVISAFGGGANNVINTCYTDAGLGGVGSPFCNVIQRGTSGQITEVSVTSQNVALLTLTGVDVSAEYTYDAGNYGLFGLTYLGTFTDDSTLVPFAGGNPITCAGEFGADCGEPVPSYKHRAAVRWAKGPYDAQLLWRHVGSVDDDGGLGFTLAVNEIDPTNYFDLSGSWDVNDNVTLTGGIDNLLDEEPPILGDNQEQANTWPATYDVFGRTFFARATLKF